MTATSSIPNMALVVEDETLILMETADLLRDAGFSVLEANNAQQALSILEQFFPIRLMVTDVHMPGPMKGFELARTVHAQYPGLSIIVCSGQLSAGVGEMPAAATFMGKPLSAKILAPVLKDLLRGGRADPMPMAGGRRGPA